jgi:hypothetical protein
MPKKNGQDKQDWLSIKAEKPNYNHIHYNITLENCNFSLATSYGLQPI